MIELDSEAETERLGRALADVVGPGSVIGLVGPLGAGKTRLVAGDRRGAWASTRAIASPTFVLIHEYEGRSRSTTSTPTGWHARRRSRPWGWPTTGSAGGVCLVEWADRVADLLPADAWIVRIEPVGPRPAGDWHRAARRCAASIDELASTRPGMAADRSSPVDLTPDGLRPRFARRSPAHGQASPAQPAATGGGDSRREPGNARRATVPARRAELGGGEPFRPSAVSDFEEAGLNHGAWSRAWSSSSCSTSGTASGRRIADELGLPFGPFPEFLRQLKNQQIVDLHQLGDGQRLSSTR